jgi:tRNA 2-thiouridine synthesizing protein A
MAARRGEAGLIIGIVTTLDARGLSCPLPLVLARRRLAELAPGERLLVLATDPEAPVDLAALAADEGHGFCQLTPREPGAEGGHWLELELRKRE